MEQNNPKISVIFTSYNHREFLQQAVESILNQDFKDFEFIIVDDCSTDGSQEILKQYEQDVRVKLFLRNVNTGSYVKASNYGAKQAVGDYFIFAQCDDYAEKDQLSALYNVITQNPNVGIVFSSSNMIDSKGSLLVNDYDVRSKIFKKICEKDVVISKDKMRSFLIESCVIPNLSAALLKRECYENVDGLNEDYFVVADWLFWLLLTNKYDFYYIRNPKNNFRQHDSTIRSRVKIKRQILELYKAFYFFIKSSNLKKADKTKIRINLAGFWLKYIKFAPKAWLFSFLHILLKVLRKDMKNLVYIPIGYCKTIFNYLIKN